MMEKSDPAKYRRLCEPRTSDEVNVAINTFFEELGVLREKHGIADVSCVVAAHVKYETGEGQESNMIHFGDSQMQALLLAWGLGKAQEDHRELINKLRAGGNT